MPNKPKARRVGIFYSDLLTSRTVIVKERA